MASRVKTLPEGWREEERIEGHRDSLLAKRTIAGLVGRPVTDESPDILAPEAELALAWSSPKVRPALSIALQLDRRLARIVSRTSEPVLGQMRLAWWREALSKPPANRPRGDAVLDAIGVHWAGREAALTQMVDGWELLFTVDCLGHAEAKAFGKGRGAFFAALAGRDKGAERERLAAAGYRWALADAATAVSDAGERLILIEVGLACADAGGAFPSGLRGLAVLEALALRALRRGGRPLMEGRGAPIAAFRTAIFMS
jgi:phytoene synthase